MSPKRVGLVRGRSPVCWAVFAILAALPSTAEATTITYDGSGKVTGITDLMVNGNAYDVEFKKGTFNSVFGTPASFDFTDSTSAQSARQAVMNTLNGGGSPFLALTDPTTNRDPGGFAYSIPYEIIGTNPPLRSAWAGFNAMLQQNKYNSAGVWADYDNVNVNAPLRVWADFTAAAPVPEPSSALALTVGLAVLAFALGFVRPN